MKKKGVRGSDEAFFKLIQFAGEAVLKLAGVSGGFHYEMRAETLKEKKVSPDIVAVPKGDLGEVVILEFRDTRIPSYEVPPIVKTKFGQV